MNVLECQNCGSEFDPMDAGAEFCIYHGKVYEVAYECPDCEEIVTTRVSEVADNRIQEVEWLHKSKSQKGV